MAVYVIHSIHRERAMYSFGNFLKAGTKGWINKGIGSSLRGSERSFVAPTVTFASK